MRNHHHACSLHFCLARAYCSNSGGGGERVLWQGIQALQSLGDADSDTKYEIVIYSGDEDINMFQAREAVEVRGPYLRVFGHVMTRWHCGVRTTWAVASSSSRNGLGLSWSHTRT